MPIWYYRSWVSYKFSQSFISFYSFLMQLDQVIIAWFLFSLLCGYTSLSAGVITFLSYKNNSNKFSIIIQEIKYMRM